MITISNLARCKNGSTTKILAQICIGKARHVSATPQVESLKSLEMLPRKLTSVAPQNIDLAKERRNMTAKGSYRLPSLQRETSLDEVESTTKQDLKSATVSASQYETIHRKNGAISVFEVIDE